LIKVLYRIYKKPSTLSTYAAFIEEADHQHGDEEFKAPLDSVGRSSPEGEEGSYSRFVQVAEKSRVKQLKKQILEDLGLQEMCDIRLYHKNEVIIGDMDAVRDL